MKTALTALFLAAAAPAAAAGITIVDGDTIRIGAETIRIVGMDAPETARAQCPAERAGGYRAAARLFELLSLSCGRLDHANPARCLGIARQPEPDRYGRTLATITAGGKDVAAVLITEGLARPYVCDSGHCPRRAGWCGERQP